MRFRILWDLAGIMPVSSLKSSLVLSGIVYSKEPRDSLQQGKE